MRLSLSVSALRWAWRSDPEEGVSFCKQTASNGSRNGPEASGTQRKLETRKASSEAIFFRLAPFYDTRNTTQSGCSSPPFDTHIFPGQMGCEAEKVSPSKRFASERSLKPLCCAGSCLTV